jgi:hypothetical protein
MLGPLNQAVAQAHVDELHRQARARRWPARETGRPAIKLEPVTLRFSFPDDAEALARLAMLDSSEVPPGPLLMAEVAGELRAALSLSTGSVVADPSQPSTEVVELLRARASQLRAERRPRALRVVRRLVHARA